MDRTATCLSPFISNRRRRQLNLSCGEGGVGAVQIVSCLGDITSAVDLLDRSVVDGGDMSGVVSVLLRAAIGVALVSHSVV